MKEAVCTYKRLDGIVVNHAVLDPVERIAGEEVKENGVDGLDGLDEWRRAWEVNFFSVVALVS